MRKIRIRYLEGITESVLNEKENMEEKRE
jgi:hypothetical protein